MVAYKYKNEEIIKLLYYLCLLFFPLSMFSQSAVTRVVVDDQNLPISSVNVFIDNSQRGTVTDFNANYSNNNAKLGEVIVFSHLGFETQRVTYKGQQELNISLESSTGKGEPDEIVLIGYGIQKKMKS